jgi:hypothetical protein
MNMINVKINTDELRKNRNFEEVAELTEQLIDEANEFENVTKGELIRIMAEKLEEAGYPLREIREKIDERLHGKISRQHISQSLDDRFKNPRMVAAGKAVREREKARLTNAGTVGQQQSQQVTVMVDDDGDDTESDVSDSDYLERKNIDSPFNGGDGDGTGPFTVVRIWKMDDIMLNKLYGATTASAEHTYLLINPQTGRVEQVHSDIEYEKQQSTTG